MQDIYNKIIIPYVLDLASSSQLSPLLVCAPMPKFIFYNESPLDVNYALNSLIRVNQVTLYNEVFIENDRNNDILIATISL